VVNKAFSTSASPPFRYVGPSGQVPPGTGLPHAYVEIEEVEYTEKDQCGIFKNYQLKKRMREW